MGGGIKTNLSGGGNAFFGRPSGAITSTKMSINKYC